mgnify:FL=1|jgi:hypothetical protein|tara:strand:+ start:67 stop:720 length:654 start_codon:yes stop_codon:yes gene_type:complete
MNNLFIFGDSFSVDWSTGIKRDAKRKNYYFKYKEYLGRLPIHFSQIIKEELGFSNVFNFAIGGASNDSILQTIGNNIDKINKDDYVLVGWSDLLRYRILHRDHNDWIHILPHSKTKLKDGYFKKSCIEELVHRDIKHKSLIYNHISIKNILKKAIPCPVLFWTPFKQKHKQLDLFPGTLSRIKDETNNQVGDSHYGEEGMKELAKILIGKIKNNNLI